MPLEFSIEAKVIASGAFPDRVNVTLRVGEDYYTGDTVFRATVKPHDAVGVIIHNLDDALELAQAHARLRQAEADPLSVVPDDVPDDAT